jgi:hypothetical protein
MVHLNVRGLLARDASAVAQAVDAGSQDVMVFTETWQEAGFPTGWQIYCGSTQA